MLLLGSLTVLPAGGSAGRGSRRIVKSATISKSPSRMHQTPESKRAAGRSPLRHGRVKATALWYPSCPPSSLASGRNSQRS